MNYLFKNCYTVTPDWDLLTEQCVLVEDGKISSILPSAELNNKVQLPEQLEIIDCTDQLLIPGFVNAHCHVAMTLLRGYGSERALHQWLFDYILPFEDEMSGEDCYWGAKLGIAEMLASGITSFSDMYMFVWDITKAINESGIKANVCAFSDDADSFAKQLASLNTDKIRMDMAYHAVYTGNPKKLTNIVELADKYNCHVQVHVSETIKENEDWLNETGQTPTAYLADFNLFSHPTIAAHCVHLNDEDIEIMKKYNVHPCHCPSANLKLGSGIADVRKWLSADLKACIGTDGPASNNNLNMLEEIHFAAMLQKGLHRDPTCLTPKQVLKMATINGALAQGRTNTGSMEIGYAADLTLWDLRHAHTQPLNDVLCALVYSANASDLRMNMVDGEILYFDGEYKTIDLPEVIANCQRIKQEKQHLMTRSMDMF